MRGMFPALDPPDWERPPAAERPFPRVITPARRSPWTILQRDSDQGNSGATPRVPGGFRAPALVPLADPCRGRRLLPKLREIEVNLRHQKFACGQAVRAERVSHPGGRTVAFTLIALTETGVAPSFYLMALVSRCRSLFLGAS
jgi:hypothetical protein